MGGGGVKIKQSTISIGANFVFTIEDNCGISKLSIAMKDKVSILLGIDTKVLNGGGWALSDGAKVEIGKRGRFAKGMLLADENAHIKIGNDFSINNTYHIAENADTSIVIGNDCMASYDVVIRSNDSHSIFNLIQEKIQIQQEKSIGYEKLSLTTMFGLVYALLFCAIPRLGAEV